MTGRRGFDLCCGLPACRMHQAPLPACLPACLPVCLPYAPSTMPACLPAYLPACRMHQAPACLPACLPAVCIKHHACLPACLPAVCTKHHACLPACLPACRMHQAGLCWRVPKCCHPSWRVAPCGWPSAHGCWQGPHTWTWHGTGRCEGRGLVGGLARTHNHRGRGPGWPHVRDSAVPGEVRESVIYCRNNDNQVPRPRPREEPRPRPREGPRPREELVFVHWSDNTQGHALLCEWPFISINNNTQVPD